MEALSQEIEEAGDETELANRKEALRRCMEKLSESNRDLLRFRYFDDLAYSEIAQKLGKSVNNLYVAFSRIHSVLERCVTRKLQQSS